MTPARVPSSLAATAGAGVAAVAAEAVLETPGAESVAVVLAGFLMKLSVLVVVVVVTVIVSAVTIVVTAAVVSASTTSTVVASTSASVSAAAATVLVAFYGCDFAFAEDRGGELDAL